MENIILDGKQTSKDIIEALPAAMKKYNITDLSDIIGKAHN